MATTMAKIVDRVGGKKLLSGRPVVSSRKSSCTCGHEEDHKVAVRETLDGMPLWLWSDGWVTGRLGTFRLGKLPVRSMWKALEVLSFFDWKEIPKAIKEWKRAMSLSGATVETARAEVLHRMAQP